MILLPQQPFIVHACTSEGDGGSWFPSPCMMVWWWAYSCAGNQNCREFMRAISTARPEDVFLLPISRSSGSYVLSIPLLWCCLNFGRGDLEVLLRPEYLPVIYPQRFGRLRRSKRLLWWRLEVSGVHGHQCEYLEGRLIIHPFSKTTVVGFPLGPVTSTVQSAWPGLQNQVQPGSNWLRPQHSFYHCSRGCCLLGFWLWNSGPLSPLQDFRPFSFWGLNQGFLNARQSALLTELHVQTLISFYKLFWGKNI